jgi:Xaa-Pro aminopeptidase
VYVVEANGGVRKIVHAVEASILDHLPGERVVYTGRAELLRHLCRLHGQRIAVQFSTQLPIVSFLDHGTALLLEEAGMELVTSASLIQRTAGLLTPQQIAHHERAARDLYDIVQETWERLRHQVQSGKQGAQLTENAVQAHMQEHLASRGLVTDHPPIVAAGKHSADPHYAPPVDNPGTPVFPDQVVQFDMWAKQPDGVYADISWVGFTADSVPKPVLSAFSVVVRARDGAVDYIERALSAGRPVCGSEVDMHVRRLIDAEGFADSLKHRTGHAIDTECHGSGVNIDSVEFPDERSILEGSCFSIEPGLYLQSFGVRTEIDVYIADGMPVVSGDTPQKEILTF